MLDLKVWQCSNSDAKNSQEVEYNGLAKIYLQSMDILLVLKFMLKAHAHTCTRADTDAHIYAYPWANTSAHTQAHTQLILHRMLKQDGKRMK